LVGGLLIGTAAALLLVLNGRIAGISGIVGGLLQGDRRDAVWRIAFLSGLIIAPILYVTFGGHLPAVSINSSAVLLVLAGLLVGFGTRLAAGCTSGHGVCGIGRGSPRSVVATGVFLAAAIAHRGAGLEIPVMSIHSPHEQSSLRLPLTVIRSI